MIDTIPTASAPESLPPGHSNLMTPERHVSPSPSSLHVARSSGSPLQNLLAATYDTSLSAHLSPASGVSPAHSVPGSPRGASSPSMTSSAMADHANYSAHIGGSATPHTPSLEPQIVAALDNLLEPDASRTVAGSALSDDDDAPDALGMNRDGSRRLSFVSYADIINAERSEPHSMTSSPAPASHTHSSDVRHNTATPTHNVARTMGGGTSALIAPSPLHPAVSVAGPTSHSLTSSRSTTDESDPFLSSSDQVAHAKQTPQHDGSSATHVQSRTVTNGNVTETPEAASRISDSNTSPSSSWDMLGLDQVLSTAAGALGLTAKEKEKESRTGE